MLDFIIFIGRINYKYYMEDLFMSKYYSINKFSKILGVSAQTLRNWDKKGKPFEIISYIGSGINYKKKGLKELIDDGGEEDKKKGLKELIDDGGEEDDKNNSSHADPK
jgi:hypothetical protein